VILRSITLENIRNHRQTTLALVPGMNIVCGPNGVGKTSILEAVSLCAMARSFVPVSDAALAHTGSDAFSARAEAVRDLDVPYRVTVQWREGQRKRIASTSGDGLTARDLLGELPVVALSPDHKSITFGAPAERRAFLDAVLAQASQRYRDLLYEHRRLLKQRNAILADAEGRTERATHVLEPWTDTFADVSAHIVVRRRQAVADLAPRVRGAYLEVSGGAERIDVHYVADGLENAAGGTDHGAVALAYQAIARRLFVAEVRRGQTLFGPQKDDLEFTIDGRSVRESASQGQHKSLLVALKLAECSALRDATGERPVVLLDDVFSELDHDRCRRVMERVLAQGMQCLLTTTDGHTVRTLLPSGTAVLVATVRNGEIVHEERHFDAEYNDGTTHR
jgi:DNA replication and repair protein RecF